MDLNKIAWQIKFSKFQSEQMFYDCVNFFLSLNLLCDCCLLSELSCCIKIIFKKNQIIATLSMDAFSHYYIQTTDLKQIKK